MPGRIILVVDDNEDLADNIAEILEMDGHEPKSFGDPREVLAWAQENPFELALLDVRMPFMDGPALYERLRTQDPRAQFLFVTAYDDDRVRAIADRDGVEIVDKPFQEDALLEKVRGLLQSN